MLLGDLLTLRSLNLRQVVSSIMARWIVELE